MAVAGNPVVGTAPSLSGLPSGLVKATKYDDISDVVSLDQIADGTKVSVYSGSDLGWRDVVVLADVEAKQNRIPAADVDFMAPQRKSLMPELLLRDMSLQQVADLLAFLSVLKDDDLAAGK